MKKIKLYLSEEDIEDLHYSFQKEEGSLWNTWHLPTETGETIKTEIYLGNEEDINSIND